MSEMVAAVIDAVSSKHSPAVSRGNNSYNKKVLALAW